jgi:stage II sporulation protein GA (sporulation sigma-E factor processing peptidase)
MPEIPIDSVFQKERRWSMYYEVYIDILFLVNFMMDTLVLLIVRRILGCNATLKRVLLGSASGALFTCLIVVLPFGGTVVRFLLFHLLTSALMLLVGLNIRSLRSFAQAYAGLYISTFLLGGIFSWLAQYIRYAAIFFAVAAISYLGVLAAWKYIVYLRKIEEFQCNVTFYLDGEQCNMKALIDTGNSLMDPDTGKPVCIVERRSIEPLLKKRGLAMLSFVPYRSLGNTKGELPTIEIGKICIHRQSDRWIENPVIGISSQNLSARGNYQMILHPDML